MACQLTKLRKMPQDSRGALNPMAHRLLINRQTVQGQKQIHGITSLRKEKILFRSAEEFHREAMS